MEILKDLIIAYPPFGGSVDTRRAFVRFFWRVEDQVQVDI